MIAFLCAIVGGLVIGLLFTVGLLGWGGSLPRIQRQALVLVLAGLVWAAPSRWLGLPPGPGDLIMLVGLLLYIGSQYGAALRIKVDALDGMVDGRFGPPQKMKSDPTNGDPTVT